MFGLHVLFVYAFKRLSDTVDRDEAVFEEIQRRANLVPPAQRQAAIDAMKKDYPKIEHEVYLIKKQEKEFSDAFTFVFWCTFWAIVIALFFTLGGPAWWHNYYCSAVPLSSHC